MKSLAKDAQNTENFFSPEFISWDIATQNAFLKRRVSLLNRKLAKQERIADTHRRMYRAIRQKHAQTMAHLREQNCLLDRLTKELAAEKENLEMKVHSRTKALEEESVRLEQHAQELEKANSALDYLLKRHNEECKALIHNHWEQQVASILPDLSSLRKITQDAEQLLFLDRVFASLNGVSLTRRVCLEENGKPMLTKRESVIVSLLMQDKSYQEVSNTLNISPRSVETHCYNIRKKFGVERNITLKEYFRKNVQFRNI